MRLAIHFFVFLNCLFRSKRKDNDTFSLLDSQWGKEPYSNMLNSYTSSTVHTGGEA